METIGGFLLIRRKKISLPIDTGCVSPNAEKTPRGRLIISLLASDPSPIGVPQNLDQNEVLGRNPEKIPYRP
jgi:hypothetical protein